MQHSTKIQLIVAVTENQVIGDGEKMLWHLPKELKYFKEVTLNHSVIMGRKTFESIGRPLPNRRNIIITKQHDYQHPDIDVANSIEEALLYCRDERAVFFIGGGKIYEQVLPIADRIYLTRIHTELDGTTTFPVLSKEDWELEGQVKHSKDEKHAYDFTLEVYNRTGKA